VDGLNHSVITGKCSGCVAYRAKVARLEEELAALKEAAIQPRPNGHKWCALYGMWAQKGQEIDHLPACILHPKGAE